MKTSSNRPSLFWQEHRPLVSVVIACYAVRKYLPAFLDSLDLQEIDPMQYELVFVIDGCPEDSGQVVRKWMRTAQYPVRIVEKPNGGVASARNLGFSLAQGRWITSPDPDDVLDEQYFVHLEQAFSAFPSETMFVTRLQRAKLDGTILPHPLDFKFAGETTRLVELARDPEYIHLSGGTTVWSRDIIEKNGLVFDELLRTGSDSDFNLHYLIDNGARYVAVPEAVYWYINRGDGTSIIDRAAGNYSRYELTLGHSQPHILDHIGEHCPQWLANSLLYAVYHLFRGNLRPNSPVYALPPDQRSRIRAALLNNLRRIGADGISHFRVVDLPIEIRYAWLTPVRGIPVSPVLQRQTDALQHRRRISFYSVEQTVDISVSSLEQAEHAYSRRVRSVEFLGEHWYYEHLLWVDASPDAQLTLSTGKPGFSFLQGGRALSATAIRKHLGISAPESSPGSSLAFPQRLQPAPPPEQIPVPVHGPVALAVENLSLPFSGDEVWVVDHRGAAPRNAELLYAELATRKQVDAWRVIDDESTPVDPLLSDRTVVRGTPAHAALMQRAQVLTTPDPDWSARDTRSGKRLRKTWFQLLLPERVSSWATYRSLRPAQFDSIVAGTPHLADSMARTATPYEFDAGDVWDIPLPYLSDALNAPGGPGTAETLLIAPDSRRFWGDPGLPDSHDFISTTNFAHSWNSLLADSVLQEWCLKHGLRMELLPPEDYPGLAEALTVPEHVEILQASERHTALVRARLLLTDYSDIAFDAAALGLPTLYYQFDRCEPERASLLSLPGVFDFREQGFGPVIEHQERIFSTLDSILDTTHPQCEAYTQRMAAWQASLIDDPCSRIIAAIESRRVATGHSLRQSLGSDWVMLTTPELSYSNEIFAPLHGLLARRADLQVIAAPPRAAEPNSADVPSVSSILPFTSVIDLATDPDSWASAEHCIFIRKDLLEDIDGIHDALATPSWTTTVFNAIRASHSRFGVIWNATQLAKRPKVLPPVDRLSFVESSLASLRLHFPETSELDAIEQSFVLFSLARVVPQLSPSLCDQAEDYDRIRAAIAEFVERIPPERLVESPWTKARSLRYALCSAAGLLAPWEPERCGSRVLYKGVGVAHLENFDINVMRLEVTSRAVQLETVLHRFAVPGIDLVLTGDDGRILRAVDSQELWEGIGRRYGSLRVAPGSYRRFEIPLSDKEVIWSFGILNIETGAVIPSQRVRHGTKSPIDVNRPYLQYIRESGTVRLGPRGSLRVSSNRLSPLRYALATRRRLRREGISVPERLRARRHKNILLITDRPKFGDDNGEALFRYIQNERPDLRKRTWFVLDRSAPSYAELSKTGRLVEPGSRKHRELYLNAKILFSSHISEVYNNPFYQDADACYQDLTDFTFVWLQHGVTMNAVGSVFSRIRRRLDGVVVATEHEREYALTPDFGHAEGSVISSGFPRFDLLRDVSSEEAPTILYMPTWRAWLTGQRLADGTSMALDNFTENAYFTHQQSFLQNGELLGALERSNSTLEMVLHPAMSAYAGAYEELSSERVRIHPPGSVRYRDLFARGSALVTDYSSVFFDFAYLRKPTVFDHSDNEEFRAKHYGEGIFDYSRSAPGPIAYSTEELVRNVCSVIRNGFKLDEAYATRLDSVFLHRDRDNAARTLDAALDIDTHRRSR